jgi:hypothetical protein
MKKITLKLVEFYNLDAELNGIVDQTTGAKKSFGLLGEKLSLVTKYWLTDLAKKVAAEKVAIEELRNELIKKYGKEENGNITIPMLIDDDSNDEETASKKLNPDFQQFEKEFNELLQTEKEVEYKPIKLSELEKVETSENYATFFKLLNEGISENPDNVVPMTPR